MPLRGKRLRQLANAATLAFCIGLPARADTPDVLSSVFVLMDLSTSYYGDKTKPRISQVLDNLDTALDDLVQEIPAPIEFYMLPIGDAGLSQSPLCHAMIDPRIINARETPGVIHRLKDVGDFFAECKQVVLHQKPRQATDISGALIYASKLAENQTSGPKFIIVLSDMIEDRPDHSPMPQIDVPGFRVALVYRVSAADAEKPNVVAGRLKEWSARLEQGGAEKVLTFIETAPLAPELTEGLLR